MTAKRLSLPLLVSQLMNQSSVPPVPLLEDNENSDTIAIPELKVTHGERLDLHRMVAVPQGGKRGGLGDNLRILRLKFFTCRGT
jgi:predicted methyltransferase MtxX (methanogen marker protein 4)